MLEFLIIFLSLFFSIHAQDNSFTVPTDYPSIQSALSAADEDDTILVLPGTYNENILWPNTPNLQLISESGPEQTIINGGLSGTVIDFGDGQSWGSIYLEGFTIKNGAANSGAGLRISFPSSPDHSLTMNKLIIENNYGSSGGGMWVSPTYGSIKLLSSIIRNNTGTAIWGNGLNSASFEIINTLIYNNDGGAYGYGNFNAGNGLKVINCTVVNNTGSGPNGGAFALNNGNLDIVNSIIYNNEPTDITTVGAFGNINVNNSIITNDENSVTVFYPSEAIQIDWSDNLYGINPNFTDESNEDFHLSNYSLAIGAGIIEGAPEVDIEGNLRPNPAGSNPDLGAYEGTLGSPYNQIFISINGSDNNDGSQEAPYATIQKGIDVSNDGDEIIVLAGIYSENIHNGGKFISIIGEDNNSTIINGSNGNINDPTIYLDHHIKLLENLTITGGDGGIRIEGGNSTGNFTIKNCIIDNNDWCGWGNGATAIGIFTGNTVFLSKTLIKNHETSGSPLIHTGSNGGGRLVVDRCTITNNKNSNIISSAGNVGNVKTIVSNTNIFDNESALLSIGGQYNYVEFNYNNLEDILSSFIIESDTLEWGPGNISFDPLFVSSANSNYSLKAPSRLIHLGHPDSTDIDGTRADIGAFPYINYYSGPKWYVSEDGNDTSATGEINNPFRSIQSAINFSKDNDSLFVENGIYNENIHTLEKDIDLKGESAEGTIIIGLGNDVVVRVRLGSSPSLQNFTIKNGSSGDDPWSGAGLYTYGNDAVFRNLIFKNNDGMAAASYGVSSTLFENILAYDNKGGIRVSSPNEVISHCTITDNENVGIYSVYSSEFSIINSIIYGNGSSDASLSEIEFLPWGDGIINVSSSIIENGINGINVNNAGTINWNDYNYDLDPIFENSEDQHYNLSIHSPAIGLGDPNVMTADDLSGNERPNPIGSNPDLGAFENTLAQRIPRKINVPEDFFTIQSALNNSYNNDTVLVQPGTYHENIIWPETNGIKLISAGDSSNTIIDGGGNFRVITITSTSSIDSNTVVRGFKIFNGGNVALGAGISLNSGSIILENCWIDNNVITNASDWLHGGGGLYIRNASLYIRNCNFSSNSSNRHGGGVRVVDGGSIFVDHSEFFNNNGWGGAIAFQNAGNSTVSHSMFKNNHSAGEAGAIIADRVNLTIDNCIVRENYSNTKGAIVSGDQKILTIKNSLLYKNEGGAIYIWDGLIDSVQIIDNITSDNGCGGNCGRGIYALGEVTINNTLFMNNVLLNNNGDAIYFYPDAEIDMFHCTFLQNGENGYSAILSEIDDNNNFTAQSNNFVNNGSLIFNENDVSFIDYTNNYWGHPSGPYHPSQNPTGLGDSVNGFVNIDPWLISPNTDAPPIPAQNLTLTGSGNDFISLSWDASELGDLAGYKVYYDTDESGYPYENNIDVGNVSSHTLLGLSIGATYYVAITTVDTDGNESWYSNEVTGVTRVLQAQNLDIGIDEDLLHLTTHEPFISFQYFDSMNEEQTSYQVQVSTMEDFSSVDMWDTGQVTSTDTSLAYAGETLLDGATYYLRAKVGSGTFYSEWANLTFRMNSTITMSSLTFDPELGENGVYTEGFPTMSSAPTDPEGDDVSVFYYLSDNAAFSTYLDSALILFDNVNQESVSWQPSIDPLDNQQYWVKAKGWDGYEYGNETMVHTFVINNANDTPASFALLTPEDESEVTSLTPLLDWEVSQDPDPLDTVLYILYLDTPDPGVLMINTDTLTSFQIDEPLMDNTEYFWRVVARDVNDAEMENTGGYHSFTVNTANDLPSDFALLTPENTSMVTDLTPTLRWDIPTDADDASGVSGGPNPFTNFHASSNTVSRDSRYIVSYDVYINIEDRFDGVTPVTVSETHYTPEVDLSEDVMYYWKVVATDEDGGQTESNMSSFWTNSENSVPTEVVLLTPDSEAETGLNPTFSWTASTDADLEDMISYRLSYQSSLEDIVHVETGSDLTYTPEVELMDNTEYVWHVVATDESGATYTTPLQSFSVNTENDLPDGLVLISPLNGSYTSDFNQLLFWSPATDLDNDIIGYDVILNGEWFATTSNNYVNLYGLQEDMVYEWNVIAMDNNGGETQSETWIFTLNAINEPPSEFTLLEPINNVVLNIFNPPFCWEEATDIDTNDELSYMIELGTHIDSLSVIYNGPYLETCYFETMGLVEDNSIYYWKVTAYDVSGATTVNIGGYSSFIINTMNDEPTVSELIAPLDGSIQTDLSPNFYWTESYDVDPLDHVSYSMSWWGMDDIEVQSVTLDSNGVTPESDLMDNSMYAWSVEAMDMNEATSITETSYFYTDAFPEAPENFITVAPENESSGFATEVTFVWNATTDPDPIETIHYQLVYTDNWMDSTTHVFSDLLEDTTVTLVLEDNMQYYWGVIARDSDGFIVGSNDNTPNTLVVGTLSLDSEIQPTEFTLHQNYPNPFNPTTQIKYDLPSDSYVNISIYDVMGKKIKSLFNNKQTSGYHLLEWNATNDIGEGVSAGMYIYTIQAGEYRATKKMVLLK